MEKSLFNQVGEVKGKLSEAQESFSFQFTPQNENLRRTRGSLFTLVTVEGKDEDRFEKAKAYYHAFQSSYYAKASGSIINGLSETLDQLEKDFSGKDEGLKYSLVAAVFWGAVLYLARSGGSSVWVSRSERLKKIDFNKVASGVLEDSDTVCLVTDKFEQGVSSEDLSKWLALEKFEEVLGQIDKALVDLEGAACIVIRLSVHNPEEVQPLAINEVDEEGNIEEQPEVGEMVTQEIPSETMGEPEKPLEPQQIAPIEQTKRQIPNLLEKIQPILDKIKPLGSKFLTKITAPWRKPRAGELVDHVAIRRARLAQIVVVIVLILAFSLLKGFAGKENNETANAVNSIIASIQSQLEEARNVKSIDPNRAQSLVSSAQSELEEAKESDENNSQLPSLETEIAELIAEITRSYKITDLKTVFDFSSLESGAKISRLALSGTTVLATDEGKDMVYSLDISSNSGTKVEGAFTNPSVVTGYDQGFYILTDSGVVRYSSGSTISLANNSGWGEITGAATFQANLYVLDQGNQEIWRYLNTSSGLSSARAYITGEKPDFTEANGIAIDDFVWVVTNRGQVYKFAQGKKQEFALSNMTESFEDVIEIFTNNETANLYLLDSGKGRVVVVGKDGVYQEQFSHDDLKKATDLVVREDQKTAYFSLDGKIVSFELK